MYARRTVLKGAASLPLAAILASPELARAAAGATEPVTLTTAGGRSVNAALALPATTPAAAVLLVHEWWGLNDQIRSMAVEFAAQGYVALAVDLYDGKVAKAPEEAQKLMMAVSAEAATDTLASWIAWLRASLKVNDRIATVGWCFGGGWSLNASIAAPVDATVVYYGNVARKAEDLVKLNGPVLGHFATRDGWINKDMVAGFEAEMKKAGQVAVVNWYEADHAFANPTTARYDAEDAALAWSRTLEFLKANLS
ncbi:MAG: dienelactone hydrolase family protein [Pseudomonadota bacterium]|nr:dienelactone hydrolase family protein [Pseudomonadota bacterium]